MAIQSATPAPSYAQEHLPWPFIGLSRAQALERRNRIVSWVFLVAGGLLVGWLGVMAWLFTRPTDTFEELAAAIRLQYQVMLLGVLIMSVWALPILICRYARPYMPAWLSPATK